MYKSFVYREDEFLGDVEVYPQQNINGEDEGRYNKYKMEKIRIAYFSQPSERCPPLAVLHTVSSGGICFKMESPSTPQSQDSPLSLLHSSCIRDNKTAVIPLGKEELHLVAMYSRNNSGQYPCFWAFSARTGLYNSSLVMLNLRCLGIVFDLDETLIVANTMRSFEDRIEALNRKISIETDQQRIAGMVAESKRYQDDKNILKQYIENDQVVENGKVLKTQSEVVPALSESHQPIVRPLIRLQEKNIILTRINPVIRDTSVLVRLRPAWEDLRSYLIARGRKRFEVYVCTMAEREYALEMWRLLDPDFNLISSNELLERIVCVKSGLKKSLFDVFQDGTCHPKMALVIDDRLKVWNEKDQPRVHVVPAFAPYYAPQAEENNDVPILCVARNVACNVRGGFFKDFDEYLLQRIAEIAYEDNCRDISSSDVSTYLVPEDDVTAVPNRNKDPLAFDGMTDAEVESRLKDAVAASSAITQLDPRLIASLHSAVASSSSAISLPASLSVTAPLPNPQFSQPTSLVKHFVPSKQTMQSSPAREEGEVPESELDPDTRRRLLILQHGQDSRDPAPAELPPTRPSIQVPVPRMQSRGSWARTEEEISPKQLHIATQKEYPVDLEMHVEKQRSNHPLPFSRNESAPLPERIFHENQRSPKEMHSKEDVMRSGHMPLTYSTISGSRDHDAGRTSANGETPAAVLLDIAMKCGAKVEFRPGLVSSVNLQFAVEAWFEGDKIGEGVGRTRREAQRQAAESSLRHLADIYLVRTKSCATIRPGDGRRISPVQDNGSSGAGLHNMLKEDIGPPEIEQSRFVDPRLEGSKLSAGSVIALRELCMVEGLDVDFQLQPQLSDEKEIHVQVEIDGQVLGRGAGLTWEEAKMHAAERALGTLRSMIGQKRQSPPGWSFQEQNKRQKPTEYSSSSSPRVMQRMSSSSSTRHPKNVATPPVP